MASRPEPSENSPALIEAVDVSRREADDSLSLDAVSLTLHRGEIYCLLGTAGSGKTLLLHAFLGLSHITGGRIAVTGLDVATNAVLARRAITYVARGASVYGSMTARQNVDFFATVDGSVRGLRRQHYYNAMRRVGIAERAFERPAAELAPAAAIALWLAVGLLKETPVLLMDEPTVGLDFYASAELQETLLEFRRRGSGLLISTTDVLLAARVADRIGIMKQGRKTVELTRQEFAGRSLPQLYLDYMGRPLVRGTSSVWP